MSPKAIRASSAPALEALHALGAFRKAALPVGSGALAALRSACEERHQAKPAQARDGGLLQRRLT